YYLSLFILFFFNDPPTTSIYTLSLHDALPIFARFGVEKCGVTLCGAGEAVRSKLFVDENRLGAQNFRKLPAGDAAQQIHLPEAVLCHDVALSLCEIFA